MKHGTIDVKTSKKIEFIDITSQVNRALSACENASGICFLYNPHTTSALTINEGADPAVQEDIISALKRIVPFNLNYKHLEGNSPAHLMTSMIGSSEMIYFDAHSLSLGTWQRVFFCEFDGPRNRKIHWRLIPS